jgi:hypothetical protein
VSEKQKTKGVGQEPRSFLFLFIIDSYALVFIAILIF